MADDRAAFAGAVRATAFRRASDEHPDGDPELLERYPGGVVHSFLGAVGADWSADAVCDLIETAHEVGWEPGAWMAHELRVEEHDGPRVRVYHFNVRAPAGMPVWLAANRADGYGKVHAALAGETRARCGAPVRPPRTGALATPFRPSGSRCVSCARLIADDTSRSAGQT